MAVKLFKLRHVPDDEAEDIRQLLGEHKISFYETTAGGWGISVPAIWLHDGDELERAKALIEVYQQQRGEQARAQYLLEKEQGQHVTWRDKIIEKPFHVVMLMIMVLFVLYVTLAPFVDFLK